MPENLGAEITCKCGCGRKFVKNSVQHVYFDGSKCRVADVRNQIELGLIKPSHFKSCEVCGKPVPVYKEISGSANRLTCDNKCGAVYRARKSLSAVARDSAVKPFRQGYCRQNGECEYYSGCLDLGARKEWPRDRGEECFEKVDKPIKSYDTRSAITMEPRSTMTKTAEEI